MIKDTVMILLYEVNDCCTVPPVDVDCNQHSTRLCFFMTVHILLAIAFLNGCCFILYLEIDS